MISEIQVKMKPRLVYGNTGYHRMQQAAKLGQELAAAIKKRIKEHQMDGMGNALPPLPDDGRFLIASDDPRYKELGLGSQATAKEISHARNRKGIIGPADISGLVKVGSPGTYANYKTRKGKKPVRDGDLTGQMWRSMYASVIEKPDHLRVIISFGGSSVVQGKKMEQVGETKRGKPIMRVKSKKVTVRNRTKAEYMHYTHRSRDTDRPAGTPHFSLMTIAPQELTAAARDFLRGMRLFKTTGL